MFCHDDFLAGYDVLFFRCPVHIDKGLDFMIQLVHVSFGACCIRARATDTFTINALPTTSRGVLLVLLLLLFIVEYKMKHRGAKLLLAFFDFRIQRVNIRLYARLVIVFGNRLLCIVPLFHKFLLYDVVRTRWWSG